MGGNVCIIVMYSVHVAALKVKWKPQEVAFPEINLSSLEVTTSLSTPSKGT